MQLVSLTRKSVAKSVTDHENLWKMHWKLISKCEIDKSSSARKDHKNLLNIVCNF